MSYGCVRVKASALPHVFNCVIGYGLSTATCLMGVSGLRPQHCHKSYGCVRGYGLSTATCLMGVSGLRPYRCVRVKASALPHVLQVCQG